jgi:hypothetical protein
MLEVVFSKENLSSQLCLVGEFDYSVLLRRRVGVMLREGEPHEHRQTD